LGRDAIDAPHVGERSERDLSAAFVEKLLSWSCS